MMLTKDEKGTYFCVSFQDVFDVVFGHKPLFCSNRLKLSWVIFAGFTKSIVQFYTDFKAFDFTTRLDRSSLSRDRPSAAASSSSSNAQRVYLLGLHRRRPPLPGQHQTPRPHSPLAPLRALLHDDFALQRGRPAPGRGSPQAILIDLTECLRPSQRVSLGRVGLPVTLSPLPVLPPAGLHQKPVIGQKHLCWYGICLV